MKLKQLINIISALNQLTEIYSYIALGEIDATNRSNTNAAVNNALEDLRRYPSSGRHTGGVNAAVDGVFSALEEFSRYPDSYDAADEVYSALEKLCHVMLTDWPYSHYQNEEVGLNE